jgi:hypothetical protein
MAVALTGLLNNSHYENVDHSFFCIFHPYSNAGLLRDRTRDGHDEDKASDY